MRRTGVSVILTAFLIDIEVGSAYTANLTEWLHAQQDVIIKYLAASMPKPEPLLTELDLFNKRFEELIERINKNDTTIRSYAKQYVVSDGPPHIHYYIDQYVFMEKYKWTFEDTDKLLTTVYRSFILWMEYSVLYSKRVFWFHPKMTPPPGWDNVDDIPDFNETWYSVAVEK